MKRREYTLRQMIRACNLGLVALAAVIANAQELHFPSPDGGMTLFEKASSRAPELWIENARTHQRTKLFDIGGTVSAGWSADGNAFYVNDHLASDQERAYIFNAATLKRLDIAAMIQAADPQSRPFTNAHAYFEISRWEGAQDVSVRFFGHTDEPPARCFAFRYRISQTGVVKKLWQHIAPFSTKLCEG
jgi:hypothetical protein